MGFKGNIWAADLAYMGSLSSKNYVVKYLLCTIDVFTKYAWIKPLANKKTKTVLDGFTEVANESYHKLNKSWIDQGRQFYNKLMKNGQLIMAFSCTQLIVKVSQQLFRGVKGR